MLCALSVSPTLLVLELSKIACCIDLMQRMHYLLRLFEVLEEKIASILALWKTICQIENILLLDLNY